MNLKDLPRRGIVSGAILITGSFMLTACSSGTGNNAGAASASGSRPEAAANPVDGAAAYGAAAPSTGRQASQTAAFALASQSIIYTASLTLRSADVAASTQRAIAIAQAAGGYVSDEHQTSGSPGGTGPTVSLTLKIPVPAYQSALTQLSAPALGKQVAMQQRATDVTEQVADVDSLVTSEQDAIAALQGLLRKAGSVSGLLEVQQQISSDESSLDSLQAQQRALDHETSYATVSMTLRSPQHAARHKKAAARRGFLAGLSAGWRALRHATAWVLTALGVMLPFAVIAALLAGLGYGGWRRFGRRRSKLNPAA